MIQPGQITLAGNDLRLAVVQEARLPDEWSLDNVTLLLERLAALHLTVALTTCRSGWACSIARTDIVLATADTDGTDVVREFGYDGGPAHAVARAALHAIRVWSLVG